MADNSGSPGCSRGARRSLDFLDWQEGQLQRLQVEVRRNTYLDADEIAARDDDTVILATGSSPTEAPTQRFWPQRADAALRGPHVWPAEAVMAREARPGKRVLVLDEGGNYKGVGTAWHLAEAGIRSRSSRPTRRSARS